ncbi:SUMF1/EgtB/PvdO family nonheme iron enzyme [Marinomonas sp. IMCC 4694]|uniref:SUMF1/EgtB/PvdO family nonheme iron enzyme n=1 Tax=Marinomonas sp. IMCC 4694 TaxID=2605432 RepID=UPI0011E63FCE|nr:SUMF1/EgtB/PvdO family nonheme iron enzyme [Marinomonas sp. IMCC 4694]TYL47714.1 SUMF1/EgtB/PvdO family nonheme iron enzyme [Marinomonas sp. IMCC 4694]
MNDFYDPIKLKIGQHVGVELDPYVLNYPMTENKSIWVADQGGRPFVLRFFQPERGKIDRFLQNARKYATIKHPAITPNYPPFYSRFWVFSCSAVCGGENLYSFLGKYPEGAPLNVVISLFDNIATALDQVHKNNLYHGHLDLSAIHVVNGLGLMTGFGAYNWMDRIDDSVMDRRFLPPEYLKKEQKRTVASDRFAFMRLLMAALLGESILDKNLNVDLPDAHPNLSHSTWDKLVNWSHDNERSRPKSLTEVVRILRANHYKPEPNDRARTRLMFKRFFKKPPFNALLAAAFASTTVLAAVIFWPERPANPLPVEATTAPPRPTETPISFESLPQVLEEPLTTVSGKAPKIEKIAPATFIMGDQNRMGDDNELPAHEVDIPKGFYISKYEVTFDQYDQFANATNRVLPPDNGWGRGQRPVINVSWHDAKAYTAWISAETSAEYRLPTEIEWEYSARADSTTSFWYGNSVKPGYSVCDSCGSQWDGISSAPVGSQASNPLGLFDMHGNVAEWIEDCYHDNYDAAPTKNQVWLAKQCDNRVLRGGSWFDIPRVGRSATRFRAEPNLKASNWGFRVVRIIQQSNTTAKSE